MMTERTDTMKTYLLRKPQTVEPQNARRAPRTRPPATATTAREVPDRPAQPKPGPSLFTGLDVHTDPIAVSLAAADRAEVRHFGWLSAAAKVRFERIRALLDGPPPKPLPTPAPFVPHCPCCKKPMLLLGRLPRPPPSPHR